MVAASLVCWGTLTLVMGPEHRTAVLSGSAGPLVAALGTWIVVERLHRHRPAQVSSAMIKLFAAKMLFFGAYVAAAVMLLPRATRAFVVSFTSQYIMLHFIEAVFLRRLFAGSDGPASVD
jgi:hypothetical protein